MSFHSQRPTPAARLTISKRDTVLSSSAAADSAALCSAVKSTTHSITRSTLPAASRWGTHVLCTQRCEPSFASRTARSPRGVPSRSDAHVSAYASDSAMTGRTNCRW